MPFNQFGFNPPDMAAWSQSNPSQSNYRIRQPSGYQMPSYRQNTNQGPAPTQYNAPSRPQYNPPNYLPTGQLGQTSPAQKNPWEYMPSWVSQNPAYQPPPQYNASRTLPWGQGRQPNAVLPNPAPRMDVSTLTKIQRAVLGIDPNPFGWTMQDYTMTERAILGLNPGYNPYSANRGSR